MTMLHLPPGGPAHTHLVCCVIAYRNHSEPPAREEAPEPIVFAVTAWEAGSKCIDYYMTWRAHPVRTLPLPFNLRGVSLRRRHAQRAHQTPGMCIRGARRSFISSRGALISPAELEKKIDRFDTDFRRLARVLDREFKRVSCVSPLYSRVICGADRGVCARSTKTKPSTSTSTSRAPSAASSVQARRAHLPPGITVSSPDDAAGKPGTSSIACAAFHSCRLTPCLQPRRKMHRCPTRRRELGFLRCSLRALTPRFVGLLRTA